MGRSNSVLAQTTLGKRKNKMCNYIFSSAIQSHQKNAWEKHSIKFWDYAYLSHVRVMEPIINTYYSQCGSYVTNNGYGYIAKSRIERSLFSKVLDLFNGNLIKYIHMKQRYNRHSVTVEQMQQFRRTRSRINKANANRKSIKLTFKQTEIFSRELRNRVLAKGHKIAS